MPGLEPGPLTQPCGNPVLPSTRFLPDEGSTVFMPVLFFPELLVGPDLDGPLFTTVFVGATLPSGPGGEPGTILSLFTLSSGGTLGGPLPFLVPFVPLHIESKCFPIPGLLSVTP